MRVPLDWLHEYCRPPLETSSLAERLTMTGTKVERDPPLWRRLGREVRGRAGCSRPRSGTPTPTG